jgi:peptide/nickel transport system permease protein
VNPVLVIRYLKATAQYALRLVLVILLVSFGTFMLLHLTPGNPAVAILGQGANPKAVHRIDHQLGLDRPIFIQYGHWLSRALRGNLGTAMTPPYGTVVSRIKQALPISLELVMLALVLALIIAIPVGIVSAYREGRLVDRFASNVSFGVLAVPTFVSGLVLALLLSLEARAFPRAEWASISSGIGANLSHAFLPALTLALPTAAAYSRLLRAEMIQTLQEPFVLFARAKGLPDRTVLLRYAFRPSAVSLITLSAVTVGALVGGTVIVETIYALPGMGSLLIGAISANDYPLVQGIVLVIAVVYVLVNAAVDLCYGVIDPRVRRARG